MYYPTKAGKFEVVVFILMVLFVVVMLARSWVSTQMQSVVESRSREALVVQKFYGGTKP